MPRNPKTAAASSKAALPQLTAKMLEKLIPDPVSKEQFEDIFQNFKHHVGVIDSRPADHSGECG